MTDHSHTSAPLTESEIEIRRLRRGRWIEAAARDIATSPACGDIASSSATAIARVIRKHLAGGV